jgi:putative Mg2+ transporter-C (MgtC) family protein
MPSHVELLGRILLGSLLGAVIGFERNLHSRHVVLRTHILVAMASASFMVVSAYFALFQSYSEPRVVEIDASRIAASVVSGIGFLAGGVILKSGATVQGLTTAASLWLATAVGLTSGAGMPIEAGGIALMGVSTLALLRRFEEKKERFVHRKVVVVVNDEPDATAVLLGLMSDLGVRVSGFDYERQIDDHRITMKFEAHIPVKTGADAFIRTLEAHAGVRHVRVKLPA